jgi:hypothetical protein
VIQRGFHSVECPKTGLDSVLGPSRVTFVCDNLNTHTIGAFYQAFEPERAREYMRRIQFCYTPKHGSWLNVAECELSCLTSQRLLGRRIGDLELLQTEICTWSDKTMPSSGASTGNSRSTTPVENSNDCTPKLRLEGALASPTVPSFGTPYFWLDMNPRFSQRAERCRCLRPVQQHTQPVARNTALMLKMEPSFCSIPHTNAAVELLSLAADVLDTKPGQTLVVADSEDFTGELLARVKTGTNFDLLVPILLNAPCSGN